MSTWYRGSLVHLSCKRNFWTVINPFRSFRWMTRKPYPCSLIDKGRGGSLLHCAPPISRSAEYRHAWADYLITMPDRMGSGFEYWGTLTYRNAEEMPSRHAKDITERRFKFFLGLINKNIYGNRWKRQRKGVWGAYCTELHMSGFPHHHFIMGGDGLRVNMRRLSMMDIWDKYFGIARIWDYKGQGAARYLTKYVTKGGVVDVFKGGLLN